MCVCEACANLNCLVENTFLVTSNSASVDNKWAIFKNQLICNYRLVTNSYDV